ncbi:GBS Bsp-like repeat-containing protein, partial [[Clostridium] spiroforme]|nr:GBS Bsp-like repeat-containing protein [Thomasclavelia spiroformis]
ADHNNETGKYNTHIYAYTATQTGTYVVENITVPANQAPTITEAKISGVTASGYTVQCTIKDDMGISKVELPTWTEKNGQDDLEWINAQWTDNKDGTYTVSYQVKT